MSKKQSLNGTKWRCVMQGTKDFGKTCTVIDGVIDLDWEGQNTIKIRYEDGSVEYPKLYRFVYRFEQISSDSPVCEQSSWQNGVDIYCPHCHTKQDETLYDLTETGDMEGAMSYKCEHCEVEFKIEFEYRPYVLTTPQ